MKQNFSWIVRAFILFTIAVLALSVLGVVIPNLVNLHDDLALIFAIFLVPLTLLATYFGVAKVIASNNEAK